MGDPALHCSQSALALQPASPPGYPERDEGWGRICGEGSGALLVQRSCAPSQDYAAPPLSSPAWLLPVLNDFCVLCLILPFTCSCSPSPQLPMLHSGMLRRPRVGAPLLSPRCNSHAAARFLFKQPTPPPKPLAFSRAGQGASWALSTAVAGSAGGCAQASVGAQAVTPRRLPLLSASSSGESYWPESAAVAESEVSETLI